MSEETTTIAISRSTKERLDHLKVHPNQSYEEVVIKLLGEQHEQSH